MDREISHPTVIAELVKILTRKIHMEFKELKFDRHVWAKVVNVGINSADVILADSVFKENPVIMPNVPNYTGQTLIPGDVVYLLCINGNLSNSVIHLRKRL